MRNVLSVTKLNKFIKDMFTQNQFMYNILVKGEISNFKESRGNYYFSLKDETSSISCILFSNFVREDINDFKDGIEVVVSGKVSVYEKNGTYAIYVSKIENTGIGEYYKELEKLKKKLYELGMFDDLYKKEINKYSMNIGVVTAKNGAAIKDIFKTIKNKNPYAKVYLYPAVVQGDMAAESIVKGIMELDKMGLDTIIVGRGGGSIEDLYCFNDERVAYAIFNANTPIISAVGHEINDSISDLVADKKVATPTAAGEMATFSYIDFENDIENYKKNLYLSMEAKIESIREKLENRKLQLDLYKPESKILRYKERLNLVREKLNNNIEIKISELKSKVNNYIEKIASRDVLSKVKNGFVYTVTRKGKKLRSIKDVKIGEELLMRLSDGFIKSAVVEKRSSI